MCSRKVSAGASLLKSLSAVIPYLNIPGVYTFFHEENLRKDAKATCTYFNVIALQFKIQRRVYSAPNWTFFFIKILIRDVWLATEYLSGKKRFNIPLIL